MIPTHKCTMERTHASKLLERRARGNQKHRYTLSVCHAVIDERALAP